jgi:hypothetical protein
VFVGFNRCGAPLALAMAVALGGCSNFDTAAWFSKPVDLFGSRGGYSYSNLDDTKQQRPITANDFVDANGACPRFVARDNMGANSAPAADAASLLGGGVAIGMSECEVVAHLGQPTAVNLGRNPNGDRTAALTFKSGPRPGLYRFAGGRLEEMDRVEMPAPLPVEPAKKKKVVRKKPVKPEQQTSNGKT